MMGLFLCPGVCRYCSEKNCPQRGELDKGFIRDLAETPSGKSAIRKYERLKSEMVPEFLVPAYLLEIRALIDKVKERKDRFEEIIEEDIIQRTSEILRMDLPSDIKLDERDQIPKLIQACAAQVGKRIYCLIQKRCNELFCGSCCILPACDQNLVRKV